MRINPCPGCGEYVDIASDHAADCPTRTPQREVHEWQQWIHKSLVLNQNRLPHWTKKFPIVADLRVLGKVAGKKLGKKFTKVKLEVTVAYPTRFSADAQNYYPTMKAFVDGLVDQPPVIKGQPRQPARGILADDSDAYFSGPFLTGHPEPSGRKDFFRFDCRLEVID